MLFNALFSAISEHHPTYHWTTLQYLHIKPDPANTWAWGLCYEHKYYSWGWSHTFPTAPLWGGVTSSHPLTFPPTPSHPLYYYYYFYDHVSWSPFLTCSIVERKYWRMKNPTLVEKHATRAPGKRGAHIFTAVIINHWNNELKDVTDSPTQCSGWNLKIFCGLMNFILMVCYLSPVLKRPMTNPYLCGMKNWKEVEGRWELNWVTGFNIRLTRSSVISSLFHLCTPFKHKWQTRKRKPYL